MLNLSLKQFHYEVTENYHSILKFISLPSDISSEISIPFIAYQSFIISEFFEMAKKITNLLTEDKVFNDTVNKARVFWKFWSDKSIAKTKKALEEYLVSMERYLTKDYNNTQKEFINLFGQDNLGLTSYNNLPIFHTIQGQEIISEIFATDAADKKNEVLEFSSNLSSSVSTIKSSFDKTIGEIALPEYKFKEIKSNEIHHQDYHKNFRDISSNDFDQVKELFYLNILCNINYLLYITPSYLPTDSFFYFRMLIITYISSCESLRKLINKNEVNFTDHEKETIIAIISVKESIITSELRNNIFHYLIDTPKTGSAKNIKDIVSIITNIEINDFICQINEELEIIQKLCGEY